MSTEVKTRTASVNPETKDLPSASQRTPSGSVDVWQPMETTAKGASSTAMPSGRSVGKQGRQQTARESGTEPPPATHWPCRSKEVTKKPSLSQERPPGSPVAG